MFWRWRTDVWGMLCLAVMWGTAYTVAPSLPDQVPLHWNTEGSVTTYASRWSIWLLPAIALLQWTMFKLLGRRYGIGADVAAVGVTAVLGFVFLAVVGTYLGYWSPPVYPVDGGSGFPTGVLCLILGAMSWLAQRIEPNTVIGFRTRWTLESNLSWVRSHRLAAQSSPLAATVLILPELLGVPFPWPVALGLFLAWATLLWRYSYVQWRDDPERSQVQDCRPNR